MNSSPTKNSSPKPSPLKQPYGQGLYNETSPTKVSNKSQIVGKPIEIVKGKYLNLTL